MREIKFRAWDDKLKVMFTQEKDNEIRNLWAIPKAQGGLLTYPNGVLMQYTDLKDKNGKEIYEGDILKHRYASAQIVQFIDGGFDPMCGDINCPNTESEREVIGNIHENPELIK